jgi:two-component system nitrogen regulation sensor histidine kinase NtrY
MRLAPSLVLAFGFVATLSVAGLGYVVREEQRASETARFERDVGRACDRIVTGLTRQADSDRKLIAGACQSGELVDRALIWLVAGTLDGEKRLALSRLVPEERQAFDLDALSLRTADGDVLGEDPVTARTARTPLGARSGGVFDASREASGDPAHFSLVLAPEPASVAHCSKDGSAGRSITLVGSRRLGAVAARLAGTMDVQVALGHAPDSREGDALASCALTDAAGAALPVYVAKPKTELVETLQRIDRTILLAALASTSVALALGVLLARSLGRPIAKLAAEASKVASGEARPIVVRGPGEIAELARAFAKMVVDLEATRERLAATSRVAAWREVARRVAHEVKNPLAPIRAAVETLRRLRARDDPEFYAYFDEATRTVLAEVHRISNIVTEFTRFARLSPPRPKEVDVEELVRQVVGLQETAATGTRVVVDVIDKPPTIRADPDQVVQILTNLLQNALDAVRSAGSVDPEIRVTLSTRTAPDGAGNAVRVTHAVVTVADNGDGIAPEMADRLFQPYATTKGTGTGLGLAIAQRIAIEHDGELSSVASPSRRGAAFRLALPVNGPPEIALEGPASGQSPSI